MNLTTVNEPNNLKSRFEFNKSGCCLNPIKEVIYNKGNEYVHIVLAEKKGNWYFGYSYTHGPYRGGGCCSACTGKHRIPYPDKMQCRFAAISAVLECIKNDNDINLVPVKERLEGELLGKQLNLF